MDGENLSTPAVNDERGSWFEIALGVAACLVLFLPPALVYFLFAPPTTSAVDLSAETVGIGVILRATMRRLFRSGSRSVLQTAVGTVTRASARTMTRRVVRVGFKSLSTFVGRAAATSDKVDDDEASAELEQTAPLAVLLGFATLALSLLGVLWLLDVERPAGAGSPLRRDEVVGPMPLAAAVVLGAAPLLFYAGLLLAAAPRCGAAVRFRTGWEAMLLQGYFTGSGSYLPLATDSHISGPPQARGRLALIGLGGLFALHLLCGGLSSVFSSYPLEYLSGMFLLFCFVFSFPLAPLDGYYVWAWSRWAWLLIFVPILVAFVWTLPEPLHVIL